jgi:hypothetical protein
MNMLVLLTLAGPPVEGPALVPHVAEQGGTDGRIHLQLSGDVIYGIGGQSYLGGLLRLNAYKALWDRGRATGSLDLGAQLGYGNEPVWLAPWLATGGVQGATHRIQAVVTIGHTFHIGKRRRFSLGTHLYAGLNHWRSSYSVDFPDEGVKGRETVTRNLPLAGGQLELGYRFHRRVGLHWVLGGPFPTASSYAITFFHAGLGLSFYLR